MAGTRTHVLAIDQGTTGSTALVLDPDARVVGRGYTEFAQHYPRPGWVEHDPDDIWRSVLDVAGAALADAGLRPADVAAVGITNQRETVVLWDRRTGDPVAPAVVWQDRRTAGACDELRARGLEALVRRRTGLVIDAYFSGTKVAWLLDHVDGLRARAEAGEIAFGTVDSWLLHRLTGGRVHVTDPTNASRTMLFDIGRLAWDDELLAELRVPRAVLPTVVPSLGVAAETDPAAFLGITAPVGGVLGDQQAALLAQACTEPGSAKNTYGTGSFVLMNTGSAAVLDHTSMLTTVALSTAESTSYALEGPMFVTGSAVQWLRDELGVITAASDTEALARSVPDTGDVWFVPALAGLGAPYWDPYARGLLLGITRGTGRAQLVRAVLESIAYLTRDVTDAMQHDSGQRLEELRVDGGAAANRWLMQFQADVLGVPVDVPFQLESTSLGSGLLAGIAAGIWPGLDAIARARTTAARYEPQMGTDEREARFARWHRVVDRARDWADDR
ncbi:MAG TPA: glycerol kinase GlpK [Acidimicrobiales bacterium]|nr:glycerol kinase GlpK [Acidimicrobiales bacterium]